MPDRGHTPHGTVGVGDAIEALIQIQAFVATKCHLEMVAAGLLTVAAAGERLDALADDIEAMDVAGGTILTAAAVLLRDYAAEFRRGTVPNLRLVKTHFPA
jgi:hypothetical protein